MEIIAAVIAAVAAVVGIVVSSTGQDKANQQNKLLAQQGNEWNIEQWNRENQYNLPSEQMQRYKDAGLNPNLIYGQSNYSATSPRANVASVSNAMDAFNGLNISGISDAFTRQRRSNIGQQNADTASAGQQSLEKVQNQQAALGEEAVESARLDNQIKQYQVVDLMEEQSLKNEAIRRGLNLTDSRIRLNDRQISKFDEDYQIALEKLRMDVEKHPYLLNKLSRQEQMEIMDLLLEEELHPHKIRRASLGIDDRFPASYKIGSDLLGKKDGKSLAQRLTESYRRYEYARKGYKTRYYPQGGYSVTGSW